MEKMLSSSKIPCVNIDDPFLNFYFVVIYHQSEEALPPDFPEFFPEENQPALFAILDTLSETERTAIISHFGLDGEPRKSFAEIGRALPIPTHRKKVARILKNAKRNLRKNYSRQLVALLYSKQFYQNCLNRAQIGQAYYESKLCMNFNFQEFLRHIKKAKTFLEQPAILNLAEEISTKAKIVDDCTTSLRILANPTTPIYQATADDTPKSLIDDARQNIDRLLKIARWIDEDRRSAEEFYDNIDEVPEEESIRSLNLSVRTAHTLQRAGILTLGKLSRCTKTELELMRGLGKKSIQEITDACREIGIELIDD